MREEPIPTVQDCSDAVVSETRKPLITAGGGHHHWSPFCVRTRVEGFWETSPIARQMSVVDVSAGGGSRVPFLKYNSTHCLAALNRACHLVLASRLTQIQGDSNLKPLISRITRFAQHHLGAPLVRGELPIWCTPLCSGQWGCVAPRI